MASLSSLACIHLLHSLEPLISSLSHAAILFLSSLSSPSSFLFLLLLSFCFPSLFPFLPSSVTALAAIPSTQGLNLFSINANGLHNIMKTNVIKHHISSSSPHIWLINETKSHTPVASRVHVPNYNIYKSPVIHSTATSSKWEVIATVRRDLHSQRVPTPDGLAGHVVVLDVAILTASARGFILRILAIYAPWDPGGPQPTPQQFWSMLTPSIGTPLPMSGV